jgi:hypothetical protein
MLARSKRADGAVQEEIIRPSYRLRQNAILRENTLVDILL